MSTSLLRRTGHAVLIAGILLMIPDAALAQALTPNQTFMSMATNAAMMLIGVLNFLSWFVLSILDHIMDPQYIFQLNDDGGDGSLLLMLRTIWQFVRDLVNIGFAIGLIVFAILMILSADFTKIKEHLPKFVVAIVLVNFSWFIPRVIFDVSQVMTYTVYQIPSLLGADRCELPALAAGERPRPCEVILSYKFFDHTRTVGNDGIDRPPGEPQTTGWRCPLRGLVCVQMAPLHDPLNPARDIDLQVNTATKVLDGLVVNHARLQWLAQIQFTDAQLRLAPGAGFRESFLSMGAILIKLAIVLILHVAIAFPLMAMAAAFFIRIPVLWVSMAFMPLVALGFAFPKLQEGEYKELFWGWLDQFMNAVFLPLRVAVPFTIGFIMLNAGAAVDAPRNFGPAIPVFLGVRDLWQFLWMGIAMFIIWKYSFEALKGDKAGLMGQFSEKIQGIGSSLGNVAMQWPLSWQFIPMPGRVNGEQQRISPLQALHNLNPRTIESNLRLQSLSSIRHGETPLQGNPAAIKQIQDNRQVIDNRVTVNIRQANEANGAVDQNRHLDDTFRELRGNFSTLNTMSEEDILRNLRAANVIDQNTFTRLNQLVTLHNRQRNTTTPAP